MANFQAYNDKVWTLPIKCFNPTTSVTTAAFPSGTAFTVTSSLPNSLSVAFSGNDNTAWIVLTPKVQASPGISVTVAGTNMVSQTLLVDVVADPAAQNQVSIDTSSSDVTTAPQNVPTAAGP